LIFLYRMEITESGLISTKGELKMPMDRIRVFFAQNKGKRVIMRLEAVEPHTSIAQIAYYYKYIIPTIKAALIELGERKTEEQIDRWLMEEYPGGGNSDTYHLSYARQFSKAQMSDFLDWVKQFAAENLYVYIEDTQTI